MIIKFILFLILAIAPLTTHADTRQAIAELNQSLAKKHEYEKTKLDRIQHIRDVMATEKADYREYYRLSMDLFNEYRSYKYDSAYHYARQSLKLAILLNDADYQVSAHCAVVFCMLSAGLYKEAVEEVEKIKLEGTSPKAHKHYYQIVSRLYFDLSDYNQALEFSDKYVRAGSAYTDSVLKYVDHNVKDSLYAQGIRQVQTEQYEQGARTLLLLLNRNDVDLHTKAIITSTLGWLCTLKKQYGQASEYLAKAAIYDNESVTKETTALCNLAELLYKQGDIKHATHYVELAMEDATFYDARQRIIQTGQILPIIEEDRFNIVERQRSTMMMAIMAGVLLILALLVFSLIIRKQIIKLQRAKRTIEDTNHALQKNIDQMKDANRIKDVYVGQSIVLASRYATRVDNLIADIKEKLAYRQYDELQHTLNNLEMEKIRVNMFAAFDNTFLEIFPQFVERYNDLFDEKDRKYPPENTLTTEMRIFALIRLGIGEAERIATVMNLSVHTINTYKTRVKNKAKVENDEFEHRIMEIGKD